MDAARLDFSQMLEQVGQQLVRSTYEPPGVSEQLSVGELRQSSDAARHELRDDVALFNGCDCHEPPYTRDLCVRCSLGEARSTLEMSFESCIGQRQIGSASRRRQTLNHGAAAT
jgi:hypothetical protein